MESPSTTKLVFKVKGNSYEAKRITVGHLMRVEIAKSDLTGGKYGMILANRTTWSEYTLDNVDMFAHLLVFFPNLTKDLNVNSWEELDPFDLKELRKEYGAQFVPWFTNFTKLLKETEESDEESE